MMVGKFTFDVMAVQTACGSSLVTETALQSMATFLIGNI
jgi:hypothetical protein